MSNSPNAPATMTHYEARGIAEAQAHVVSAYHAPIALMATGDANLRFTMSHARSSRMTIGRIRYGADVEVLVDPLTTCYQINLTLAGSVWARQRGAETSTRGRASGVILDPDAPFSVCYSANAEQFAIKVPCRSLESHLASLLGRAVEAPVRFEQNIDLSSAYGETLLAAASHLHATMDRLDRQDGVELIRAPLESYVLTGILLATRHPFREALGGCRETAQRAQIRAAAEFIRANAALPITVVDIARHVYVGVRALQIGFNNELGMSPTAYLRDVRLRCAYQDIVEGEAGVSITEIACRWGFSHLGRFAQSYRNRFGILPSDTPRASA